MKFNDEPYSDRPNFISYATDKVNKVVLSVSVMALVLGSVLAAGFAR